ncbi:MAG: hypothetical protein DRP79_01140 [Planctomycetota bacterium]|nr:MAG: hypothetical protein DRP79_01140 [Planctomycetota bacterium]
MSKKPGYIIENERIEKELTADFKSMSTTVGTASARKQRTVNVLIFSAVAVCFFLELFHPLIFQSLLGATEDVGNYAGKTALAIAVFLISVKLGYYLHNAVKFNHYTFWVFASLEARLLEIKEQLQEYNRRLKTLERENTTDNR